MTGPSSNPRGEHPPAPGRTWHTALVRTETVVEDGAPEPRTNRAARRAARRQKGNPMSERVSPARLFVLQRDHDVTGVSGTGIVADGVLWPDGTASVRWRGPRPSTVCWDYGLVDVEAVHGHGGATRIIWTDTVRTSLGTSPDAGDSPADSVPVTSTDSIRTLPAESPAPVQAWTAERAELLRTIEALRSENAIQHRQFQLILRYGNHAR
ncbi:hypothetical protein [Streptomyces roseoverticillatus]|uniref:hypothetical protein n=1 Tax=Streptomyces roseoverticillatus TaxID=66429 RepID=UPI001F44D85A|nr:hypothetical protein [Streptomyces roseoverticillatus]